MIDVLIWNRSTRWLQRWEVKQGKDKVSPRKVYPCVIFSETNNIVYCEEHPWCLLSNGTKGISGATREGLSGGRHPARAGRRGRGFREGGYRGGAFGRATPGAGGVTSKPGKAGTLSGFFPWGLISEAPPP